MPTISEEVAAAAIVTTTISKREKRRKNKNEEYGINLGICDTLLSECRVEEEYDYRTCLRIKMLRKHSPE